MSLLKAAVVLMGLTLSTLLSIVVFLLWKYFFKEREWSEKEKENAGYAEFKPGVHLNEVKEPLMKCESSPFVNVLEIQQQPQQKFGVEQLQRVHSLQNDTQGRLKRIDEIQQTSSLSELQRVHSLQDDRQGTSKRIDEIKQNSALSEVSSLSSDSENGMYFDARRKSEMLLSSIPADLHGDVFSSVNFDRSNYSDRDISSDENQEDDHRKLIEMSPDASLTDEMFRQGKPSIDMTNDIIVDQKLLKSQKKRRLSLTTRTPASRISNGKIRFNFKYDGLRNILTLTIINIENLAPDKNSDELDVFVKTHISKSVVNKRENEKKEKKTKHVKGSHQPTFNDPLKFTNIRIDKLDKYTLTIKVCNHNHLKIKPEVLGKLSIPLRMFNLISGEIYTSGIFK